MKYMEKRDRAQISFLPECVEDYIDDENPVRVIDAFQDRPVKTRLRDSDGR